MGFEPKTSHVYHWGNRPSEMPNQKKLLNLLSLTLTCISQHQLSSVTVSGSRHLVTT